MNEPVPPEDRRALAMRREDAWRQHYRKRRYAQNLNQQELNARIRDIMINMLVLTKEAKIGLLPVTGDGPYWIELFTHVLEEMRLRHGPYPAGFSREVLNTPEPFPNFVTELGKKAATVLSARGVKPGEVLIKYGKAKYMRDLFHRGALRIQPATYFLQRDHNGAVRDDERSLALTLHLTRDDILKLVKNPHDVPPKPKDQRLDFLLKFPSDYWLYCVSASIEPRLFVDFQADACVIIRDKKTFVDRLIQQANEVLQSLEAYFKPAVYVDPLLPKTTRVEIPFAKHFRYTYQKELRFAWVPAENCSQLNHLDLELGSLEAIAEYIAL